ncbi:glycosyltransferase family 87 protein [Ralstonia sp. UBA689]|uniref:glycosyltransferase family 87 protein n=1 Tax=Ralstonia sp. UBA689 TaxID=1947373 RepID=UPI0025F981EB|nr:glycosyltransferase family 87 protein [Ralstonia sp. UBA689]
MPLFQQKTKPVLPALTLTLTSKGQQSAHRLAFYATALLFCEVFALGAWLWGHAVLKNPTIPGLAWDLGVFWSASSVALLHGAPAAYDWELLRAAEAAGLSTSTFGPFPYPPTFLLLIYPLGKLPFGAAALVLSAGGVALYLTVLRSMLRLQAGWFLPTLAFPGVWVTLLAGQNSLFTLAAAAGALLLLRRHPIASGACIAVLCIKPQLGVLFPLFLLCQRQWTALASAAVFSILSLALSWLALGTETFLAFTHSLAMFRHVVVENGDSVLYGAPTVFGVLRTAGCSLAVSYLAHALASLLVVSTCVWLWRSRCRFALRAATLPIATMLVQPYLLYYDLAWLALPIAWLTLDCLRHGSSRSERAILVASWLVPAQAFFVVFSHTMGQWAPLVLIALLVMTAQRARQARRSETAATPDWVAATPGPIRNGGVRPSADQPPAPARSSNTGA